MAEDQPRPGTEGTPQTRDDAQTQAPAGGSEPPAGAASPADETAPGNETSLANGPAPVAREHAEARAATAEDLVQAATHQAAAAVTERDEAVRRAERAEQEAQHAQAAAERARRERDDARAAQQATAERREEDQPAAERPSQGEAVAEWDLFLDERDILTRPVAQRGVIGRLVSEEAVRAGIALLLFVLLAAVILVAFLQTERWEQTKQLLDAVLPTVTALLGSAIGFYFGTRVIR